MLFLWFYHGRNKKKTEFNKIIIGNLEWKQFVSFVINKQQGR